MKKITNLTKSLFVSYNKEFECKFSWQTFYFRGSYHYTNGNKKRGTLELNVILN